MKKTADRKLALQRETLRCLQILVLKDVVAGVNGTGNAQTCSCTCNS